VKLDHGFHAVRPFGAAPHPVWQPAGVKIRINRDVVAKALWRSEQCVELHLFHRSLGRLAGFSFADSRKNFIVDICREPLSDPGLLFEEREVVRVIDDSVSRPTVP